MESRLPVTSSRRCEQITAFGASEVPEVKINAQIASRSGSMPGSSRPTPASASSRSAPIEVAGSSPSGEPFRDEDGSQPIRDRFEQGGVAGFGQHEAAMGVLGIAEEVLIAAGVVEADDGTADERGAAEREEIVGGVVEQHRDVARRSVRQPLQEQVGEARRLGEVLAVRPHLVAEADRHAIADVRVGGVGSQQRRGIRRDERRFAGRRNRSVLEAGHRDQGPVGAASRPTAARNAPTSSRRPASVFVSGSRPRRRVRRSVAPAATSFDADAIVRSMSTVPLSAVKVRRFATTCKPSGETAGRRDPIAHRRNRALELDRIVTPRDPPQSEAAQPLDHPRVDPAADPDRYAAGLPRLGHHVDALELELG